MLKLFTDLHEDFFENDDSNKMVTGIGFVMSAVCILIVFGLYQL